MFYTTHLKFIYGLPMNSVRRTSNSSILYFLHPLCFYFKSYFTTIKNEGFRSHLSQNIVLWLFLVVANIADILVTYSIFAEGGIEVNPAMAFLCTKFGNISLAFYKGILLGALFILLPLIKAIHQKFLIFTCFIYIVLLFSHAIRF